MTKPVTIGITGSIGMGKSTTAKMFLEHGVPVWDADAAVRELYQQGGKAVGEIAKLIPEAVRFGAVDRTVLKQWIQQDPNALTKLNQKVHPLVAEHRVNFIKGSNSLILALDMPLLFEIGEDKNVDFIVVATTSKSIQTSRVLARGTMTNSEFEYIVSQQMPDSEKRKRADFVVHTTTLESARAQVRTIIDRIKGNICHA